MLDFIFGFLIGGILGIVILACFVAGRDEE